MQMPEIKHALRELNDEALAAGVFGVPTVLVGGELFWGDDRLEEAAAAHTPGPVAVSKRLRRLSSGCSGERSISSWRGEGRSGSLVWRGRPRLAQWPTTSRLRQL